MAKSKTFMKSVRSTKSIKLVFDNEDEALDFDELVADGCTKFNCPNRTVVRKDYQLDEFLKSKQLPESSSRTMGKSTMAVPKATSAYSIKDNKTADTAPRTATETKTFGALEEAPGTIVITAMYDAMNRFYEILLHKQKLVPRELVQILGYIAPNFKYLTKMSFKSCRIDGYTIYEMNAFLPLTSITEICFDGSRLQESEYGILLDKPCSITSLSLSRCQITDGDCAQIAAKLHILGSAETTLAALNLSSNRITDVGAESIGEALRTNRHLRYLNLADNRISDDGADHILRALIDFTLTCDEIMAKRRRYFGFLKTRQAVYLKYLSEWDSKSMDDYSVNFQRFDTKKVVKQKKEKVINPPNIEWKFIHDRADMMATEIVGKFSDPFASYYIKLKDAQYTHCIGNMVLCYLNMSYNNLSLISLRKVHSALVYQSIHRRLDQTGLLKVVIDGNPLPNSCVELESIAQLLQANLMRFGSKFMVRRKSRSSRISIVGPKKQVETQQ